MEKKNKKTVAGSETRREFIKKSAAVTAVAAAGSLFKTPVYGQNQAPSSGKVIGANDRIVVAHIGTGSQGMAHVRSQHTDAGANNIVQVAACDVYQTARNNAKAVIGDGCELYEDYRKLLERKDIDAVTIATVDHWHTQISLDALHSGKHVYVEKPMTRYLGEAFQVHDAVKSTGKILQVGSQGCSDAKWHKAGELIRGGKVGPLVLGQGSYMRNSPKGEWNYTIRPDATAQTIDWKMWMGPVHKKVDFNADHFFRWRKYYPYCAGMLGDLVPHRLHPLMLATGNPEFPSRVVSIGTRKIQTDKNTPGTPIRDVAENIQLVAEFPTGLSIMIISSTVNETGLQDMIRGQKGTLYFAGDKVDLRPEKPFADDIDPYELHGIKPTGEHIELHEKNWFDCIRANNPKTNCNIDLAIRAQTVISLAEMSDRLKIACLFDEKTRKVTTGDGREVAPLTYGSSELS